MKPLLFSLLLASSATATDHAAWTHHQRLSVPQTGLMRVELDPALLDASVMRLGDLRLLSPTGVEMPYVLLTPTLPKLHEEDATGLKQTLEGQTTQLEFQLSGSKPVNLLRFGTSDSLFIKAVKLEASRDGSDWQMLAQNVILCRQVGFQKMELALPADTWRHFRLRVDDSRTAPVVFTGVHAVGELEQRQVLPHTTRIVAREEKDGSTLLQLDLGARNLPLASLRLITPESVFDRTASASLHGIKKPIFRLQYEGHHAEDVELHLNESSATRQITLTIDNGDNPPLKLDSVELTRHALPLLFQADAAGEWRMLVGNAQSSAPSYDLAKMASELRRAPSTSIRAASLEPNPEFHQEATLPATNAGSGEVKLDTSAWQWRRVIQPAEKDMRVFRIDLDDHALTHAQADGSDLRVIAGEDTLVRHLMLQSGKTTMAAAEFDSQPDAKRPKISRWRLTLPLVGLPVKSLHLTASSTLFERSLTAYEMEKDPRTGQQRSRQLGYAFWKSTPDAPQAKIRLELNQRPHSAEIWLETDNGDNPLLQLTQAEWEKPVVSLLFEAHGAEKPLHLLYGNAKAVAPQYDIALVRDRFEKATHVATQLGDAEALSPAPPARESHSGSPWLWAAMAVVVLGLLWVVARLLPKA